MISKNFQNRRENKQHQSSKSVKCDYKGIKKVDEKRYDGVKRIGYDRLSKLLINWQPDYRNRRLPKKRRRDNLREGLKGFGLREIDTDDRNSGRRK